MKQRDKIIISLQWNSNETNWKESLEERKRETNVTHHGCLPNMKAEVSCGSLLWKSLVELSCGSIFLTNYEHRMLNRIWWIRQECSVAHRTNRYGLGRSAVLTQCIWWDLIWPNILLFFFRTTNGLTFNCTKSAPNMPRRAGTLQAAQCLWSGMRWREHKFQIILSSLYELAVWSSYCEHALMKLISNISNIWNFELAFTKCLLAANSASRGHLLTIKRFESLELKVLFVILSVIPLKIQNS